MRGFIRQRAAMAIATGVLVGIMAGCSHDPDRGYYDLVMKRAGVQAPSEEYALGWRHGCHSGEYAGGLLLGHAKRKDETLYAGSGDYMRGWDDGYVVCFRRVRGLKPQRD